MLSMLNALGALIDLVLPHRCAGCRAGQGPLCEACRETLAGAARPHWPRLPPPGLPQPWAVAPYDGAVRRAIIAYKERGRVDLTRPLAHALARAVAAATLAGGEPAPGGVVAVAVPATPATLHRRGRDPCAELAAAAVSALRDHGVPARAVPLLRHARHVADQAGLAAGERVTNRAGSLVVVPGRAPAAGDARLVLVDDVVTTGATLAESARALRASGMDVTVAAAVAATPRRRGAAPAAPPAASRPAR